MELSRIRISRMVGRACFLSVSSPEHKASTRWLTLVKVFLIMHFGCCPHSRSSATVNVRQSRRPLLKDSEIAGV